MKPQDKGLYELVWEIWHATFILVIWFSNPFRKPIHSNQTMLLKKHSAVYKCDYLWADGETIKGHTRISSYSNLGNLSSRRRFPEIDVTLAVGNPGLNILLGHWAQNHNKSTHSQICPALFDMSVIRQNDQPITYSSCRSGPRPGLTRRQSF